MNLEIAELENRESRILWLEGLQKQPVVERTIETAHRDGWPNAQEIGVIEPGLVLYGYSELRSTTGANDKGHFQRRVFFRNDAKPGVSLPGDRMMRPDTGKVTQNQPIASMSVVMNRSATGEDLLTVALARAGAYGDATPSQANGRSAQKPGELPDYVYGG